MRIAAEFESDILPARGLLRTGECHSLQGFENSSRRFPEFKKSVIAFQIQHISFLPAI